MRTLLCLTVLVALAAPVAAADVSGLWDLEMLDEAQRPVKMAVTFKQKGEKLTGDCKAEVELQLAAEGSIHGNSVDWKCTNGPFVGKFIASIDDAGERMKGTWETIVKGTFTATKHGASTLSVSVPRSLETRAAVPIDPISAILDAFKTHQVVALGEGEHGNQQGHAFRLSLIRDSRFAAAVNDIVVEFGNSRYQDVMNRFIRGEQIADAALRRTWEDTTQAGDVWDHREERS